MQHSSSNRKNIYAVFKTTNTLNSRRDRLRPRPDSYWWNLCSIHLKRSVTADKRTVWLSINNSIYWTQDGAALIKTMEDKHEWRFTALPSLRLNKVKTSDERRCTTARDHNQVSNEKKKRDSFRLPVRCLDLFEYLAQVTGQSVRIFVTSWLEPAAFTEWAGIFHNDAFPVTIDNVRQEVCLTAWQLPNTPEHTNYITKSSRT